MSGTNRGLRLMELASAHLCQAISAPVEQLVDMLTAAADMNHNSTALHDTFEALTSQLRLRSMAWGLNDQTVSLVQIGGLAPGLPGHPVLDLSAMPPDTVFAPPTGRIVLNLLLLAADSLPAGGCVMLAGAAEDLFIRIAGPAAAWPMGLALCLTDERAALTALDDGRSLQMGLTAVLAHAANIPLSVLLPSGIASEPAILRLGG